jgi:hypothetical protein
MKLLSVAHRHGYSYWEQGVSQPGNGYGDYRHPVRAQPARHTGTVLQHNNNNHNHNHNK